MGITGLILATYAGTTASDCQSCAAQGKRFFVQKLLGLFPDAVPLPLLGMEILGQVPKTKSGDQHVVFLRDRYTKLGRAIPVLTVT